MTASSDHRCGTVGREKPDGAYPSIRPVDLHAYALRSLIERTGIDPAAMRIVAVERCSTRAHQLG